MTKEKIESTLRKLINEFYEDFQMRTGMKLHIDTDNWNACDDRFYAIDPDTGDRIDLDHVIDSFKR